MVSRAKRGLKTNTALRSFPSNLMKLVTSLLTSGRSWIISFLLSGQTPAAVTAASGPALSSGSSYLPMGQATSLPQPSTTSGSVNPSVRGNLISSHTASASHTGFLHASQDLQDHAQTLAFQGHACDAPMTHSPWPFIPLKLLTTVFIGDGFFCTGPASKLSPAATT